MNQDLTPREIVTELDKYIVGQANAKKSVAIALRNRYRRQLLPLNIQEDIVPKNIIMMGPTGVGKTEIARRMAKLVNAPFIKIEATKFTEVGYVGRDVESMIKDLVEMAVRIVKEEKGERVKERATELANERILDALAPKGIIKNKKVQNPMELLFGGNMDDDDEKVDDLALEEAKTRRQQVERLLELGEMEDHLVDIEVEDNGAAIGMMGGNGMEEMGINIQEMFSGLMPKKKNKRQMTVADARKILIQEEVGKLIDMEEVVRLAIEKTEQSGIVFLDEIDKIAGKEGRGGADVSREGVQRDILPIIEGATVMTKYGPVKSDYILFIAAGAFHLSKPSDLIPELQGRFPIRVELDALTEEDFKAILLEPKNSLIKQYEALLSADGVDVKFEQTAIEAIARIACNVNSTTENIGARRLHTIMEKVLEDLLFNSPDPYLNKVNIDGNYVEDKIGNLVGNEDLSRFIL